LPPVELTMSPAMRWVLTIGGLLLMAVAGLSNWSGELLFTGHWRVFVRFPGMPRQQYFFLPMWWVTFGVPAAMFGLAWLSSAFRRAVRVPWRNPRFGVPLAAAVLLLGVTMLPWEMRSTPIHECGSGLTFYLFFAGAGLVLFLAGFYRYLRFLDRPLERAYAWVMGMERRWFVVLLFGVTFVVTNLISLFVFEHMAHIQDSISQLFQARIFATGRLFLDSPKFPDFFDYTHVINNGRWYSQYPFLHSLLLVPGVVAGIPWIINPLLGALAVPVIYLLGRELYGERTGRMAGVLACITPFIFNMSAEYMNGASTMLFATLFVLFFFRTLRLGQWRDVVLGGLFLGLAANVRPYTAMAVAVGFAVYGLLRMVREPRRFVPRLLVMAGVIGAVASLVLVYNWLTNGHPLTFGYVVKWGPGHELGFGRSGWGAQHTPLRGLVNTGNDMNVLNRYLFEWPIPALAGIAVLLAAGMRRVKDRLLLFWFLSLSGAYFFYWFHNICFGPRFVYESVAALVILSVRGAEELGPLLRRTFQFDVPDRSAFRFVGRVWVILTVVMILAGLGPLFRRYHTYAGVDARVVRNVERAGLSNALVFCQHLGHGFSANSLALDGDVVYAKDFGVLNPALTIAYPDRSCFYANKDTLRPLESVKYRGSRLERALLEMGEFLDDSLTASYRTVIWPFRDIPTGVARLDARPGGGPGRNAENPGPEVTDFRVVSRSIFTSSRELREHLPALACWIVGDDREHLRIFSFMDDLQNFIAGEFKFTLLMVTSDGTAVVYDISEASGEEMMVPDQPTAVPLR
jgi:hypothetical protein